MGELSPIHWMIVIGVVVLLFGSRRLPDAARSVGQSLRILQAEYGGLRRDGQPDTMAATTPASSADMTTTGNRTEQDALAERAGTTSGLDRAGGGDHGVPGTGDVDDRDEALPGTGHN